MEYTGCSQEIQSQRLAFRKIALIMGYMAAIIQGRKTIRWIK